MHAFLRLVLWSAVALLSPVHAETASPPKGLRVFTCGNSFHAWYIAPILKDMAGKAVIEGHEIVGVSKIGGSQAIDHWNVPEAQNEARPSIASGKVDLLTLAGMHHPDEGIEKFATLAAANDPRTRITLQEFWMPWDKNEWPFQGKESDVDFDAATAESLRLLHAPYFQEMDAYVTALNQKLGGQVIQVVPVGQAVLALREKIIAGQVPGIAKQSELFTDKLGHPHAPIEALAAYCHFAVLYCRTPVGLPVPEVLSKSANASWRTDELNRLLQQIAWQEVTRHPLSGITR